MQDPPIEIDTDGAHARPRRSGHQWADLIIALSAITISVISLFVAIAHGRTEQELVTASTWPFLINSTEHRHGSGIGADRRTLEMVLRNAGVGPAHIQSFIVSLNGKVVHSAGELLARCCGLPSTNTVDDRIRAGESAEGAVLGVLPARETITFLGISELEHDPRLLEALDKAVPQITFSACYCSVLNQCWTTDLRNSATPQRVAQCRHSADDYSD